MPRFNLLLTGLLLGASLGSLGAAELLKEGDAFGTFEAKDQHDVAFKFEPGVRYMLFSFDMGTGKKANKVFEEKGKDYLPNHQAAYVSNIYGMPAIGRFFALPKMRRYPHRIILADAEGLLDPYPQKPDQVTVIQLDPAAKIQKISFWDPENQKVEEFIQVQ